MNCPFYFKIGACRHGDRCSRTHNKPLFSQTIMFENMYRSVSQIREAAIAQGLPPPEISHEEATYHFDDFFEDVWDEMSKFGKVEEMHVCENLSEHLAGNTYVKFSDEEAAQNALKHSKGRWYAGRPVKVEYSPVTDFRESKCRPFEVGECDRGDYCNFMHIRKLSEDLYYKVRGRGRSRYRYEDPPYNERGSSYRDSYQKRSYRDTGDGWMEERQRKRRREIEAS